MIWTLAKRWARKNKPVKARRTGEGMSIEALRDTPFLGEMLGLSHDQLKEEIITVVPPEVPWRPRSQQSFSEHCGMVMREFKGRPRIEFWHAVLIIMIRRRLKLEGVLPLFYQLWDTEAEFLCQHLTLRWLISASDTFCDHTRNPHEATAGVAASMLLNMVKLYETERWLLDSREISLESLEALQAGLGWRLLEDVSIFKVGYADMVRNLKRRLVRAGSSDATPAARIFFTVADRIFNADTVISRFRKMHVRESTLW